MPHLYDSCQASGLGQAWEKKENHKTLHNDKLPRSGFVQLPRIRPLVRQYILPRGCFRKQQNHKQYTLLSRFFQ